MFFDNYNDENIGEYESGGSFEIIPKGTEVLAAVEAAGWKDPSEKSTHTSRYIELKWSILAPAEYKNRKIFQKLHVLDAEKAEKHKRMLAAIDHNAGGKLRAANAMPTDQSLIAALAHKPMVLKLDIWKKEDNTEGGNYVSKVSARSTASAQAAAAKPAAQAAPQPKAESFDDDIPF